MIAYRFLNPAEEEMTEASLFYEAASTGLGRDFLDDVKRGIDSAVNIQVSGIQWGVA